MSVEVLIWIGILLCISQSAVFSGLNLAMFGVSRLSLEVEVSSGNQAATRVLGLRRDSNFLLTTILWGNVGINVLLTLLSNSVLAGVAAFLFSTVVITLVGEIAPQAYFSRNAAHGRDADSVAALLSVCALPGGKAHCENTGLVARGGEHSILPGTPAPPYHQ